jgi:prephenate dehydrogenase
LQRPFTGILPKFECMVNYMEMPFRNVAVVGVGLIGGSLGLAFRKLFSKVHILGVGRNKERLEVAMRLGAIDDYRAGCDCALNDRDLVILATPVEHILDTLPALGKHLAPGAVVTDVGSTKRSICRKAWESLPEYVEFIGGHPVAGREVLGVENSDAKLFANASYIFCPRPGIKSENVELLHSLALAIGARPSILTPDEHDRAMSYVSHLPQLLSTALAGISISEHVAICGSGFRDMVRLAGSPYSIWESIFATNRDNIDKALEVFIEHLQMMRSALNDTDLADEFSRAANTFRMVQKLR